MGGSLSCLKSKKGSKANKNKINDSSSSSSSDSDSIHRSESLKRHKVTLTFSPTRNDDNLQMDFSKFEKEMLEAHNDLRQRHNAGPLKIRSDLTKHAQNWAKELAKRGQMVHSKDSKFGENLAMTTKANPTGEEVSRMWYDEIHDYNFNKGGFSKVTGHFTQLVWKDTSFIGIGFATSGRTLYVVANYDPPGNYIGRFIENVVYGNGPAPKTQFNSQPQIKKGNKENSSDEKVEVSEKTNVEDYTDEKGRRARKTTKITTTTTTSGTKKSTKTKTETHIEYLSEESPTHSIKDTNVFGEKIRKIKIGDDFDRRTKNNSKSQKMSSSDLASFEADCISRHNELRKMHGASNLRRNAELQKKAQKWAEHLVKIRKLQHSTGNDTGENIAYKYSSDLRAFKGREMVDMWYNEIKDYNFNKPGFSSSTGHFTQVVWKDTDEIGVGVAYDGNGTCFCVANYKPPGNFQGEFEQNVQRKRF